MKVHGGQRVNHSGPWAVTFGVLISKMFDQSYLIQFQYITEWTLTHSMSWVGDYSY